MVKRKQQIESTFIQMFDDVYRSPRYAKYVRNDNKPIKKEDVKLRFMPAFLLQQTIIIPAALFIDHKELLSFLYDNKDWCKYLFNNNLIKIAHFEGDKDWDTFHQFIGGLTGKRPLGRSLDIEDSQLVQNKYEKLKNKINSNFEVYEFYKHKFPDEAALEILKTYAPIGSGNTVSFKYEEKYEDIVKRIFPTPSIFGTKAIISRDLAFQELKKLKWAKSQYVDNWNKLAIYAKHEQFAKSLNLQSFEFSLTDPDLQNISLELPNPTPDEEYKVGTLRNVVSKSVSADLLTEISRHEKFEGIRNRIINSLENNPVSTTIAIRDLCNIASDVMSKSHTGDVIKLFKPIKYLGRVLSVIGQILAIKSYNSLGHYVFASGVSIEFGTSLALTGYERFVSVRCKNQLEMIMKRILRLP